MKYFALNWKDPKKRHLDPNRLDGFVDRSYGEQIFLNASDVTTDKDGNKGIWRTTKTGKKYFIKQGQSPAAALKEAYGDLFEKKDSENRKKDKGQKKKEAPMQKLDPVRSDGYGPPGVDWSNEPGERADAAERLQNRIYYGAERLLKAYGVPQEDIDRAIYKADDDFMSNSSYDPQYDTDHFIDIIMGEVTDDMGAPEEIKNLREDLGKAVDNVINMNPYSQEYKKFEKDREKAWSKPRGERLDPVGRQKPEDYDGEGPVELDFGNIEDTIKNLDKHDKRNREKAGLDPVKRQKIDDVPDASVTNAVMFNNIKEVLQGQGIPDEDVGNALTRANDIFASYYTNDGIKQFDPRDELDILDAVMEEVSDDMGDPDQIESLRESLYHDAIKPAVNYRLPKPQMDPEIQKLLDNRKGGGEKLDAPRREGGGMTDNELMNDERTKREINELTTANAAGWLRSEYGVRFSVDQRDEFDRSLDNARSREEAVNILMEEASKLGVSPNQKARREGVDIRTDMERIVNEGYNKADYYRNVNRHTDKRAYRDMEHIMSGFGIPSDEISSVINEIKERPISTIRGYMSRSDRIELAKAIVDKVSDERGDPDVIRGLGNELLSTIDRHYRDPEEDGPETDTGEVDTTPYYTFDPVGRDKKTPDSNNRIDTLTKELMEKHGTNSPGLAWELEDDEVENRVLFDGTPESIDRTPYYTPDYVGDEKFDPPRRELSNYLGEPMKMARNSQRIYENIGRVLKFNGVPAEDANRAIEDVANYIEDKYLDDNGEYRGDGYYDPADSQRIIDIAANAVSDEMGSPEIINNLKRELKREVTDYAEKEGSRDKIDPVRREYGFPRTSRPGTSTDQFSLGSGAIVDVNTEGDAPPEFYDDLRAEMEGLSEFADSTAGGFGVTVEGDIEPADGEYVDAYVVDDDGRQSSIRVGGYREVPRGKIDPVGRQKLKLTESPRYNIDRLRQAEERFGGEDILTEAARRTDASNPGDHYAKTPEGIAPVISQILEERGNPIPVDEIQQLLENAFIKPRGRNGNYTGRQIRGEDPRDNIDPAEQNKKKRQ